MLVGNLEVRFPIWGLLSRQIEYGMFPIDAFLFADGGMISGSGKGTSGIAADEDQLDRRRHSRQRRRVAARGGLGPRARRPASTLAVRSRFPRGLLEIHYGRGRILTDDERAIAGGARGEGAAMAMRIVAETARLMGAQHLLPIESAHIDGALYHGDSGTLFAETTRRRRREGLRSCHPQRRRDRSHRVLAQSAAATRTRDGHAHDARLPPARMRADVDLRTVSGGTSAATRQPGRLGRIQRRRLLQFGARRPHQSLW